MRLLFTSFLIFFSSFLQTAVGQNIESSEDLSISLLTCGIGDELYSSFGHSAVRIIDHVKGTDEVYNYGTFNYSDPNFYTRFTLGKLPYYLDKGTFEDFMYSYQQEKRSVKEQVFQLSLEQKLAIRDFLEQNYLPENRAYAYDFLFDNCSTRIRDLFTQALGPNFFWGEILNNKQVSYRTVLNQYLPNKHWERFGINLLLGSPVDALMTDDGSMFLPDFLHQGFINSSFDGKKLVQQENQLLEDNLTITRRMNGPMWMMIGILILTVLSFHVKAFNYLKPILRFIVLFVTGLLGLIILFMWIGTNHASCTNNYNILWAFPLNIVVAFIANKKKAFLKIYALAGISLLMVSLIVHVMEIQILPLIEIAPLLLTLMYIFINLYKDNVDTQTEQKIES